MTRDFSKNDLEWILVKMFFSRQTLGLGKISQQVGGIEHHQRIPGRVELPMNCRGSCVVAVLPASQLATRSTCGDDAEIMYNFWEALIGGISTTAGGLVQSHLVTSVRAGEVVEGKGFNPKPVIWIFLYIFIGDQMTSDQWSVW